MEFAYTILYVEDVAASLAFYEAAFGFQRKFITPEGDYGELITGQTSIAFANLALAASNLTEGFTKSDPKKAPLGVELAFTTTHIQADFERALEAGAIEAGPLVAKPWGQMVGYVRDINGFLIEICTPMDH